MLTASFSPAAFSVNQLLPTDYNLVSWFLSGSEDFRAHVAALIVAPSPGFPLVPSARRSAKR
jgi:hypothetical protein